MLKSCPTCGRLHKFDEMCPVRVEIRRQRMLRYDNSDRSSDADRFRSSKLWQKKRMEIRSRDLNICRCCFLRHHRITTADLSVHHIIPLEKQFELRLDDDNLITLCRNCHENAESGLISTDELKRLIRLPLRLE